MRRPGTRWLPVILAAALLTGCASAPAADHTGAKAASSAAPEYCVSAQKLKESVRDLGSIDVLHGGLSAIQDKVTAVQKNLDAFQAGARTDFGPDVTALRTALGNLQSALSSVVGGKADASTLLTIVGDISAVVNAYNALSKKISDRCSG